MYYCTNYYIPILHYTYNVLYTYISENIFKQTDKIYNQTWAMSGKFL